ncbi:MAG: hypothetical protein WC143_08425 [Eubacteriales bacterium]|jgi:hypothetical protein
MELNCGGGGMNVKCCDETIENHVGLARAIERIDSVSLNLEGLIHKIDPEMIDQAGSPTTQQTDSSLHEVLAYGSSRIDSKLETIHKLIQDLRKALF